MRTDTSTKGKITAAKAYPEPILKTAIVTYCYSDGKLKIVIGRGKGDGDRLGIVSTDLSTHVK